MRFQYTKTSGDAEETRRKDAPMPHDKIKAAARKRMAETGEPYSVARREVIKVYQAARSQVPDRNADESRETPGPNAS